MPVYPCLYKVTIKRAIIFDKVFADCAGKNLVNSSFPAFVRGQGDRYKQ